jgi:hypothetical protein
MSLEIFHQCGHNAVWNRNSFLDRGIGNGLIFSPVHEKMQQIEGYPDELKGASLFDPQFYLPNSQKVKLKEYPFFPEAITDGFITSDFSVLAIDSARQCISFQLEQGFDDLVIPARFHDQMISNYFDAQDAYSVVPFLTAISELGHGGKLVYLTVAITNHMVADEGFRERLLNWITSYSEIDGIYLIISNDRPTKQICDPDVIFNNLELVKILKDAGLEVLVGYCNTESLIYTLNGDLGVTFGAYENTRIFSMDKFMTSEEDQRGPRPRIYLKGLMNWVQLEQAREIRQDAPDVWQQIYEPTDDSEEALNSPAPWHFSKSQLYHHHFENMQAEISDLEGMTRRERHSHLRARLRAANDYYAAIDQAPIDLEIHGSNRHIDPWLSAINRFARTHL